MTRTQARELAMQMIFEMTFRGAPADEVLAERLDREYFATLAGEEDIYDEAPNEVQEAYVRRLVGTEWEHDKEIEALISKYSRGWKLSRISRVAVAIMKTAICEVLYMDDIPNATAINEAVVMTKYYESQEIVSFVNGILGSFVRAETGELFPKSEEDAESGAVSEDAEI